MDKILLGIPGVCCYLDDILVRGNNLAECLDMVDKVLQSLCQHNIRINLKKCVWFATEVEYLGYVISKEGRRAAPSKVSAIINTEAPVNAKQLNSFLGLVNFDSPVLPNLSTLVAPLSSQINCLCGQRSVKSVKRVLIIVKLLLPPLKRKKL